MSEEAALVARAVPKRQREFAKGRECARIALAELGVANFALLTGPRREPLWPAGIVGSVTHTEGLCAVAVARAVDYASLGIDVEPAEPIKAELVSRICSAQEYVGAAGELDRDPLMVARLVFSAKEAIYKLQFPLTHRFVGFEEVRVKLNADGTFGIEWLLSEPLAVSAEAIEGRWAERDGFLLTVAWMRAQSGRANAATSFG